MSIGFLPTLNAILNSTTFFLLLMGLFAIKQKKVELHKTLMMIAFVCSLVFLISYLTYHYHVGSKKYLGIGPWRVVYFTILISHTVLAAALLPLVSMTFYRAWKMDFEKHRKIAKITFPIWIYVSITGVVIYAFLYL